jgi:hypothetical protein
MSSDWRHNAVGLEDEKQREAQLGDKLLSRRFECQVVEAHIRVAIINDFAYLGMPKSVRVGQAWCAA